MKRLLLLQILPIALLSACTVTTCEVAPDEKVIYEAGYHFSGKKAIVAAMVKSLLGKPPLQRADDRPVLIVYGISNRTSEHISTDAISDDIRQTLQKTGRVRFINETQRWNIEVEISYQYGGQVAAESRIERGRQVGAKCMLTGTLPS